MLNGITPLLRDQAGYDVGEVRISIASAWAVCPSPRFHIPPGYIWFPGHEMKPEASKEECEMQRVATHPRCIACRAV